MFCYRSFNRHGCCTDNIAASQFYSDDDKSAVSRDMIMWNYTTQFALKKVYMLLTDILSVASPVYAPYK